MEYLYGKLLKQFKIFYTSQSTKSNFFKNLVMTNQNINKYIFIKNQYNSIGNVVDVTVFTCNIYTDIKYSSNCYYRTFFKLLPDFSINKQFKQRNAFLYKFRRQ